MVGIVAALVTVTALLLPLGSALVVRQLVAGAADAAALAAADVASGLLPGVPCSVAETVTAAHGVVLTGCSVTGAVVVVSAERSVLGIPVIATSRAGPPGTP